MQPSARSEGIPSGKELGAFLFYKMTVTSPRVHAQVYKMTVTSPRVHAQVTVILRAFMIDFVGGEMYI